MTTNPPARYRCAEEADAVQWTGSNAEHLRAFCGSDFDTIDPEDRTEDPDETAAVRTHAHGGWLGLKPGDWVVKHADHFSAASDEEFRERWSPAVVSPPPADQADVPAAFVLWLDASDGSVPTHDGILWPDGTTTIHHRHFGHTTTHATPEAARQAAHGKQGRLVWPDAVLRRMADEEQPEAEAQLGKEA